LPFSKKVLLGLKINIFMSLFNRKGLIQKLTAFKYLGVPQAAGFALQSFLWQKKPQKRISTSIPNAKCCLN
jgi:hypothetical protein